jgi:ABC-type branched-subunit amino acid transport system substrate-binding protein
VRAGAARWQRIVAILGAAGLLGAGCRGEAPAPPAVDAPAEPGQATDPDPSGAAPVELVTDRGVTEEPCPNAVNPENGCIYLGVLSDLTDGPFAALAIPITEGQRAFWQRVNQDGGIGGYDVDIDTYTRDTGYDPDQHLAQYRSIEPGILALAQSLGTATTTAILADMDVDDVLAVPVSWWSGWDVAEEDHGLVLGSGHSYCAAAMIGLDWLASDLGRPASVLTVGYRGAYGDDAAAGARTWAEANEAAFLGAVETTSNAAGGSQEGAVGQIAARDPAVVVLAVGPAETADIVVGAAANGYSGRFVGAVPTWSPALLQTAAASALEEQYLLVTPWERFEAGTSVAHEAMRAALGGQRPTNDGFTAGWILSYPLRAALVAAVAEGELTRAGLRAVAEDLEVDYEGALPPRRFGGVHDDPVPSGVVSRPDAGDAGGLATVATGIGGPTLEANDRAVACR